MKTIILVIAFAAFLAAGAFETANDVVLAQTSQRAEMLEAL